MIDQKTYDELEERYGQVASWALWEPGVEGAKPSINSKKMSVFDDTDLLNKLHNNFVIVGLNPSKGNPRIGEYDGSWWMFHSGPNDYKLRHAFTDTSVWGSYMTDLYKEFFEADSKIVIEDLRENPDAVERAVNEFKQELEILGGNPVLIALGSKVEEDLKEHFAEDYKIYKIPNQGYVQNVELWREKTQEILNDLGL